LNLNAHSNSQEKSKQYQPEIKHRGWWLVGIISEEKLELKKLFHSLFYGDKNLVVAKE